MRALILLAGALALRAQYEVVVVGATPAGVAAAVNAAREGHSVALTEESTHIGGLVSGGLSNTDFKHIESVQGTFREFMRRVVAIYSERYGPNSAQVKESVQGGYYEPHVATRAFQEMLRGEAKLRVLLKHRFVSVQMREGKIAAARFEKLDGAAAELTARVFIDATYEGDLMAAAGVPYTVGREGRKDYGELLAGRKFYSERRFLPGSTGEGDGHVQCFNFRITMTTDPANRVPIERPSTYRRADYEALLPWMDSGKIKTVAEGVVRFRHIPNRKADVNDVMHAPLSLRLLAENDEWPEGTPEQRARIFARFRDYSLGLFWFLQNDPAVPKAIREEALGWGLPRDEFIETRHFPPYLYIREGRRMLGKFVYTENDTQPQLSANSVRAPLFQDSIAIGDYPIDSHGELPPIAYHPGVTDGSYGFSTVPFQVPFRIMVPPNVSNLLVPVALSATHVGYSAVRMEPTWTAIGQAAGLAAAQAARRGKAVGDIDVLALQRRLHQLEAATVYVTDVLPGHPQYQLVQRMGNRGFLHDIYDPRRDTPKATEGIPGTQWRTQADLHDARLDAATGEELFAKWSRRFGRPIGLAPSATRLEVLRWIDAQEPN
jgi:hypothetical protein